MTTSMQLNSPRRRARALPVLLAACALATPQAALLAQGGEKIEPGFNLFKKEQDVALGREAAAEIEKEVQIVNDPQLTNYISRIGQKLARNSQDPSYPFTFKVVADDSINAFALPGGPIYIHTGLIKAADNEAELAGVIGHEIGHVILRHSTNQASKSSLLQLPAMLAAGALDKQGGMLSALGQLGLSFGLNSAMLRYSRKAERDSDIVGARMLAKSGYNPMSMATFFEKLHAAGGGSRMPQFFSSHPDPGNRVEYVSEEIEGYRRGEYITNTRDFDAMKARAMRIGPGANAARGNSVSNGRRGGGQPPAAPAGDGRYRGADYEFAYPRGWRAYPGEGAVTVAPPNGLARTPSGGTAIVRGMMAGWYDTSADLERATTRLVDDFEESNDHLRAIRGQRRSMKVAGRNAESVFLQGRSPIQGETEYVWLVTVERPNRVFYLLMVAPESEYNQLRDEFEDVVRSIRFSAARGGRRR